MQQTTVTLIATAVGITGTLAGILIGHFLTRSHQHRQWMRDNRKQEFKEVVSTMSAYIVEHMLYVTSQGSTLPQPKQAYVDSMKLAAVVLCDRIYIHADLEKGDIPNRFLKIMDTFRESGEDYDAPADKASELISEIIAIARKD